MRNSKMKYIHYNNKKSYTITDRCLIQIDDKWKEAVVYKEEFGNQLFCREKQEFLEKFKLEE